jgi:hypothetical protein
MCHDAVLSSLMKLIVPTELLFGLPLAQRLRTRDTRADHATPYVIFFGILVCINGDGQSTSEWMCTVIVFCERPCIVSGSCDPKNT